MKIVLAVLVLMPSFAQASSYPSARPCVTDGCTPDRPGPKPLPWPKPRPKAWDADSLNGLFTGSAPKEKGAESAPVSAESFGDWSVYQSERPRLLPAGKQVFASRGITSGISRDISEARIILAGDANPKTNDGEVIGALAGAIAGGVAGPVGAVAGGVAGAIGGALHDYERKADKDEATYQKGNEDRRRDQQGK